MFDEYEVEITLTRDQLATNPCDPNVMDSHIIDRQRKLIQEKSGLQKDVNKYLDQLPIAKEKGEAEVENLIDRLQELLGEEFTSEERKLAAQGKLERLKENFKELDMKGTTVFFWNKEKDLPQIGDHMILGFLKAAAEAICRCEKPKKGTMLRSASYSSSIINQHIKIKEQFITFDKDIARDENNHPKYNQRSLRAMTAQGPRVSLAKSEVVPAGAKLRFTLRLMKNSPCTFEHVTKMFDYGQIMGLGQWRNAGHGQFIYEIMPVKGDS